MGVPVFLSDAEKKFFFFWVFVLDPILFFLDGLVDSGIFLSFGRCPLSLLACSLYGLLV